MPDRFHQQQYFIAATIGVVCLFLATYAPTDTREFSKNIALLAFGLVFGKFTNNFKRPDRDK